MVARIIRGIVCSHRLGVVFDIPIYFVTSSLWGSREQDGNRGHMGNGSLNNVLECRHTTRTLLVRTAALNDGRREIIGAKHARMDRPQLF